MPKRVSIMIVKKVVYFESTEEVEINVTFSDLVGEMSQTAENTRSMLIGFSQFLNFTKNLPDELLSTMREGQRKIILTTLEEQMARIAALTLKPNIETVTEITQ